MDADGRIIPWTEDDQGEGIKDFLDEYAEASRKASESLMERLVDKMVQHEEKKGNEV